MISCSHQGDKLMNLYIYIVIYKLYRVNKFQNGCSDLLLTTLWGNRVC